MNPRFLYIDNLIVIFVSFLLSLIAYFYFLSSITSALRFSFSLVIGWIFVIVLGFTLTMIRFWRTPKRTITALENEVISPADGNIIYIKRIEANETPISIKNGQLNELSELTKSTLLKTPCWLIGINMTPWDVHKNCAPISGKIILNNHTNGFFLSLKKFDALTMNERNTYVIEKDNLRIGIIQIASKVVRRIDTYVEKGALVKKGDWLGMIRFGSQVDVILPYTAEIKIKLNNQVFAAKTVIASL
jgi:phosphatidylserine decarboxylase